MDTEVMSARMRAEAARALDVLKAGLSRLPDDVLEMAGLALAQAEADSGPAAAAIAGDAITGGGSGRTATITWGRYCARRTNS